MRELESARLLLHPLRPEAGRAILAGGEDGLPHAAGYPLDGTRVVVASYLAQVSGGRDPQPFGPYQIVRRQDGCVIGDIGFHAPPTAQRTVTLGYGLVPAARGRGYATEALRRLLVWALAQPSVDTVLADTTHQNLPSRHVMERAGMRLVSEDARKRYYRLP